MHPEGVIQQAQQAASKVFHAAETHFLVNGTSVGIQAAVMACCPPGTTLLLPRNAHSSAFNACTLAGANRIQATLLLQICQALADDTIENTMHSGS